MQNKIYKKPLNKNNEMVSKYISQVQKAINSLNEMGLTVVNIHFEKIKPKIRVMHCAKTEKLVEQNKAFIYQVGGDGIRYQEAQMMVEGIKVVWRKYLH